MHVPDTVSLTLTLTHAHAHTPDIFVTPAADGLFGAGELEKETLPGPRLSHRHGQNGQDIGQQKLLRGG